MHRVIERTHGSAVVMFEKFPGSKGCHDLLV
jgi:hypothetical protein